MKNRFYMKEFQYHDGECYVTFNIVDLNELKNEISVAITREGKISVVMYPLLSDENGYYFEYGCEYKKLAVEVIRQLSALDAHYKPVSVFVCYGSYSFLSFVYRLFLSLFLLPLSDNARRRTNLSPFVGFLFRQSSEKY